MANRLIITAFVGVLIGLILYFMAHVFVAGFVDQLEAEEAADPAGCDATPPTETEGCVDNSIDLLILKYLPIFLLLAVFVVTAAVIYKST